MKYVDRGNDGNSSSANLVRAAPSSRINYESVTRCKALTQILEHTRSQLKRTLPESGRDMEDHVGDDKKPRVQL